MRQRVALARTLAGAPGIILLDEPFGALDAQTRLTMQEQLTELLTETGATALLVTHDIDEALILSDRVIVMGGKPGHIVHDLDNPLGRRGSRHAFRHPDYGHLKEALLTAVGTTSEQSQ